MKLYFDEHVHPLVAVMLRERGIDCRTTQEAGNRYLLRCHTRHQSENLTDHILWLQNYKEPPLL